jgi:hypothetical protein
MTNTAPATALELSDLPREQGDSTSPQADAGQQIEAHENNVQSLPPPDGGRAAWRLLIAAFVFEACLWGTLPFNDRLIPPTNTSPRLSTVFRRLPKLLLSDSRVQRLTLHLHRWYRRQWHVVPGSAFHHPLHQTLLKVPQAYDLDRMANLFTWPCCRIVRTIARNIDIHPGCHVRDWIHHLLLPDLEHG